MNTVLLPKLVFPLRVMPEVMFVEVNEDNSYKDSVLNITSKYGNTFVTADQLKSPVRIASRRGCNSKSHLFES